MRCAPTQRSLSACTPTRGADLPAGRGRPRPAGDAGERGAELTALAGAVDRYLDHLTVERGLAVHTLQAYRRDLLRYQSTLAARGRTGIWRSDQGGRPAFVAGLREGDRQHLPLAASSAGRAVVAVRGLHAFAAAQGMAGADPASAVPPPAAPRRLPRAIAVPEVDRLIAAAAACDGADQLRRCATAPCWNCSTAPVPDLPGGGLDVDDLRLHRGAAGRRQDRQRPQARHASCPARAGPEPAGADEPGFAREALEAYLVQRTAGADRRVPQGTPPARRFA